MTTTIVKVPSCWMVLLPGNRWVNLAQIAEVEFVEDTHQLVVTWASGSQSHFEGEQVAYLVQSLEESRNAIEERVSQILVP
ncbi:hypothetical protein [Laspinema palackyanum]|uniref:hypothetical protein n=1 Tax=Laspinema palackyanum TaxID=3231601 RepID=UPI00345DE8B2|nr:hypothetical protein [Laspinema sp. D2c]